MPIVPVALRQLPEDLETSKFQVNSDAQEILKSYFTRKLDIGEPLFITDIYSELRKVPGLVDVVSVKIVKKVGGIYSDTSFNIEGNTSADGRYIKVPKNVVLELKYPDSDIQGAVM